MVMVSLNYSKIIMLNLRYFIELCIQIHNTNWPLSMCKLITRVT